MQQRPAIAVVAPNVLMGVGLKAILEKIIPMADVELFGDFETFAQATPERFFHFFVAAQLFVTHSSYFRPLRHKTILLWHHGAHHHEHDIAGAAHPAIAQLSGREAEVLALIARGYMNKEIADRLQIGLTTVISHRRNIMEKLGIRSVAGLAIYAMTAGYVAGDEL